MKDFTHQKHRDMGDVITDTFKYIRMHYKSLGKALLYFVLPFYLVAGILIGNAYSTVFTAIMDSTGNDMVPFTGMDFWLGFLIFSLATGSIFTVTLKHLKQTLHGRGVEPTDLLEHFGRNLMILFGIYVIGVLSVSVGFIFFLIPGIYIGIKIILSPAVAIIEEKGPMDALTRSWSLVEGHWWQSFGLYIVLYIITTFMSYVLIIPFFFIIGIMVSVGFDASGGTFGSTMGLFYGLMIVATALFSVILIIGLGLHYFNLVERKEASGLRSQIEQLGQ